MPSLISYDSYSRTLPLFLKEQGSWLWVQRKEEASPGDDVDAEAEAVCILRGRERERERSKCTVQTHSAGRDRVSWVSS